MVTLWPSAALDRTKLAVLVALPFVRRYYRSLRPGAIKHVRVIIAINLLATFATTCEKIDYDLEDDAVNANCVKTKTVFIMRLI